MHEYSIVQSLLARVDLEAGQRGASAVHRVQVALGELSGVEVELLAKAFEVFRERTVCAAAELEVETVPARWECPRCGAEIPRGTALRCTACDRPARLAAGDEIVLRRIEMEVA